MIDSQNVNGVFCGFSQGLEVCNVERFVHHRKDKKLVLHIKEGERMTELVRETTGKLGGSLGLSTKVDKSVFTNKYLYKKEVIDLNVSYVEVKGNEDIKYTFGTDETFREENG